MATTTTNLIIGFGILFFGGIFFLYFNLPTQSTLNILNQHYVNNPNITTANIALFTWWQFLPVILVFFFVLYTIVSQLVSNNE